MQFAYQFPEITERLVLVSSGGLGPEVTPILRAASLPGADPFIAATAALGHAAGPTVGRALALLGLRPTADLAEVARGYASLTDPERRAAFLTTVRGVVGTGGQRVAASDLLYLAEGVPVLIIWGARDPIIPVHHGRNAHEAIAGSRLEVFEGVGHMPQIEAPMRFVAALEQFLEETDAALFDIAEWRGALCRPRQRCAARRPRASPRAGAPVARQRRCRGGQGRASRPGPGSPLSPAEVGRPSRPLPESRSGAARPVHRAMRPVRGRHGRLRRAWPRRRRGRPSPGARAGRAADRRRTRPRRRSRRGEKRCPS